MHNVKIIVNICCFICFNLFPAAAQKFLPPAGKRLLIIGQDLDAVNSYVKSGLFPTPGGHTTYLSFYNLTNAAAAYGGLGEDTAGHKAGNADWGAGPVSAHAAAFDAAYRNSVLVIGLSLEDATGEKFTGIGDGKQDAQIDRLARFIIKTARPVFLRIGYEFDGVWNIPYNDTAAYKAAYRYITLRLRQQGATNVATVWQASASPVDDIMEKKHENIEDWYPGDDVVDWIGLSFFLHPDFVSPVSDIKVTQRALADEVVALARKQGKPVMIAEAAPQAYDLKLLTKRNFNTIQDGPTGEGMVRKEAKTIWQEWFQPFFKYIDNNKDVIRAVAYINADWDSQRMWGPPYNGGYWGNTGLQENAYIAQQWKMEISKPAWLQGSKTLFATLQQK